MTQWHLVLTLPQLRVVGINGDILDGESGHKGIDHFSRGVHRDRTEAETGIDWDEMLHPAAITLFAEEAELSFEGGLDRHTLGRRAGDLAF